MKRDGRIKMLTLVLAGLLLAAGLALSSNMAFRYKADLSVTGRDYWVSLPYHSDYTRAEDLCQTVGTSAVVVSRFDSGSGLRQDWTCPFGDNFDLRPGEGVFLRVSSAATPVFTGAHDPNLRIPIGGFTVPDRDYILGIPYHTAARFASDLCEEVSGATLVARFDTASGLMIDWTCPWGDNFKISPGEAVRVRVRSPSEGFIPEHY